MPALTLSTAVSATVERIYAAHAARAIAIPARALRIYREILDVLPKTLADALEPITTLVEAHNL